MLIKTKYIDCASKSVFNTWKLPTSAADTSGDIYWSAVVYIKDTGEVWTHGKLYGGFFSNADNNKVSLTIGGTTKILALDGHVQSYTTLTGSGSIADQAILSTGEANKWTLKTLGKNAFSNVDYLPADATAVAAEKVVHALAFQYNGKAIHSFDGSVARVLNIIQGDNVFITGDSQGNVTIAADPGSDTVNTAGATNKVDTKLFLIGAESQTTAPQTYSNQYVYIGTDNCLYSLGKKVLTEHQAIYNLDLQTQVGKAVTKVTTFDPNAANNSFTLVQGTNVTLTPDAANKKVTISSKDTTYDFYNLVFKQGESVIDTYKPTTSPSKTLKAGTNVTFTGSNNEVLITTQDTRNTAGATEKLTTKLFLTGALTQTDNPQTYTNSKVYIGADNKLYSDGKVVSTGDHTHNYAGATSPGGPALKVDLNPSGLLAATYGSYGGILQDSNNGPAAGSWSNRIKILHNNTSGYYTELAQAFTGTAGLWHRRNVAGVVSDWTPVIDKANFRTYLDATYVIRGNDPSVLTNYVRYNQASGLTMNWEWGNATPTHIWGAKNSDSSKAYVFNGDNIRAFANAVNRAGDTMTGTLKVTEIQTTGGNGLAMYSGTDWTYLGQQAGTTYIRSGATDIYHRKNGTDYKIWDANNDGSGSGLDADLLDGVQLIQKGGNNGVLRSWARGSYTTVNQYFGNGVVVVIDPKPTDSNELWANTAIFSIGDTAVRNWQVAYGYGTDTIKARRISNGPTYNAWKTFAFLDSNVASATRADYPTGFTSKLSSATWGNQDGTFVTGWGGPSSADIQFRNNGGKLNVIIDGTFYQDEGRYKVLDTNNYSSTLDARYLLKGSGVTAGNNSSWLSFSNDTGGIGGTMGTNDQWRIYGRSTASNAGYLEIATADDAAEPIYVRQYTGVFDTIKRTATLLDADGNTSFPATVTAPTFKGALNGTAEYSKRLSVNSELTYGLSGLTYFNKDMSAGTDPKLNVGPSTQWWHILRMNHSNKAGFFADIAVPLNTSDGIYWRRITNGVNNGWYRVLDTNNYSGIIDGRYVNVTGDTMTGALSVATHLEVRAANTTTNAMLILHNPNRSWGNITFRDNMFYFVDGNSSTGTTYRPIKANYYIASATTLCTNLNADLLDGNHESTFLRYRGATGNDGEATLWSQIGAKNYHNAYPEGVTTKKYTYGAVISFASGNSRFDVYTNHRASDSTDTSNGIQYRSGWGNDKKPWRMLLDSVNARHYNVGSATKLQTARQINGTNFDGTANITTSYWGTARNFTIGNTTRSVNGSGNVTWSFADIGGAPASHSHNYINSRGNLNPQTGRTQNLGNVYSYNTVSGTSNGAPTTYTSVIGFGRSTGGTVEIAGGWTAGMGLWYRALRDTTDNWYGWVKVWDTKNFDPNSKANSNHNHDGSYITKGGSNNNVVLGAGGYRALSDFTLNSNWAASKDVAGYVKFPNGFIIQWGEAYVGANSTGYKSFPIAFPTACISVQVTHKTTATNWDKVCVAGNYTRTSCTIANGETVNSMINWMALGY